MNEIDNSTKVEMLCELAHNRVLEDSKFDNFGTFIYDEIGDYTERGVELFNEYYDYYENRILTYLKEK